MNFKRQLSDRELDRHTSYVDNKITKFYYQRELNGRSGRSVPENTSTLRITSTRLKITR